MRAVSTPKTLSLVALALAAPVLMGFNPLERNNPAVERGREAYTEGAYDEALRRFDEAAAERGTLPSLSYNRGTAQFKLEDYKSAAESFQGALGSPDPQVKARGHYNLGNALVHGGEPQDAIEQYKQALLLDPKLDDAKVNLELARILVEQMQHQQKQPRESDKGEEQEREQQEPSEQNPSRSEEEGEQQRQEAQAPQDPQGGEETDKESRDRPQRTTPREQDESERSETRTAQAREGQMSREEAERLLDSLEQTDVNLQHWNRMMEQYKRQRLFVEKDW